MKTEQENLRLAFGDRANQVNQNVEFLKDYHFGQYPDSVQRPLIYKAMQLHRAELQSRVSELEQENKRLELLIKENEKWIRIYKSSGEDVAKQMERLEKENIQQKEWLEAYKKSNAEFMKSATDQKFEIERLEKEKQEIIDNFNQITLMYAKERARLEKEVETLRATLSKLMESFGKGEPDPKCDC